jgi:hypothetical protein
MAEKKVITLPTKPLSLLEVKALLRSKGMEPVSCSELLQQLKTAEIERLERDYDRALKERDYRTANRRYEQLEILRAPKEKDRGSV